MKSEKRMVGDYTVLCAVNIGSREIILAENEQDKIGERFLCCYGERNDIFQRYSECAVGDDYIDAALFFAERIKRDAELFRSEVEKLDIPVTVIAEADCIPDHYKNDINGKVIAINPAVLKPEYRRADRQLYLVTGGFGASANSRGSAVFCTNLYDGKPTRYERMDVMGEVKTECMPHWAVNKATVLKHIQGNKLPNHLTEQWASEFLQLYPSANILVATKKDFETKNRKKFCGRIATGDYDAIIIGHSQFEKIPMSIERQRAILEQQLDEVTEGIAELKKNRGDNFSVKQLERTKKSVKQKLDKLNDQSKKDDTVTFEELGVDRLIIDESHYYKNLFLFTKMRNVGGIAQTEAMKSSDLFMKCRYLDELTGGRGTVFATGTPITNSMVELYTIQRYLQYNTLVQNNLQHFDAWASTFGETITAVELTPEGTGYRAKTRFARFYNLPELMAMFKEIADIKTADMLDLPVPKAVFHNISVKPSEIQRDMVAGLAERAERVRNGMVDARVDNMLKITNDGRKLALDQRLINPLLPDFEDSKLNACVDAMFETWERGSEKRLTQLFFCDLSTPKNDGSFNVYDDIRQKLIARGVPADEIKFIHEADTEAKKLELFKKVRRGDVRILMGSTQKMGAGTNVQNKLAASSDLDCPWRPSDLEQRLGRSIRQGNENAEVHIYRFVTEETFDAYLYQLVEGKQKFASQIMTSKSPVRSCEDIDETALSYAEIKMLATGNPHIKEKMDLDIQVQKLRLLKSSFLSEKYALEDKIIKFYPQEIARRADVIAGLKSDIERVAEHPKPSDETFVGMTVKGAFYSEKADAGNAILEACKEMTNPEPIPLGEYRGFTMELYFEAREYKVRLKGELGYPVTLGTDTFGNITRLDNALEGLPKRLEMNEMELDNLKKQFETAKVDVERPFPQEEELKAKTDRLNELNALLNVDKRENEIVGGEPDEGEEPPEKKPRDLER